MLAEFRIVISARHNILIYKPIAIFRRMLLYLVEPQHSIQYKFRRVCSRFPTNFSSIALPPILALIWPNEPNCLFCFCLTSNQAQILSRKLYDKKSHFSARFRIDQFGIYRVSWHINWLYKEWVQCVDSHERYHYKLIVFVFSLLLFCLISIIRY